MQREVRDEKGTVHIIDFDLEDALLEADEAYADKDAECGMLRGLLAEKGCDHQRYVDTLEQILDDWDYYRARGQVELLSDIQAQVELLAAEMRRSL